MGGVADAGELNREIKSRYDDRYVYLKLHPSICRDSSDSVKAADTHASSDQTYICNSTYKKVYFPVLLYLLYCRMFPNLVVIFLKMRVLLQIAAFVLRLASLPLLPSKGMIFL